MKKLSKNETKKRLKKLQHWSLRNGSLFRFLTLKDFKSAVELLNKILPLAEKMSHHPDVEIKNYNEMIIKLRTHDIGGISEYDFKLAKEIEKLISNYNEDKK